MIAGPKKDGTFFLPAIIGPYRKAFVLVAATIIPPHSANNLSFKLKLDLIKIDFLL